MAENNRNKHLILRQTSKYFKLSKIRETLLERLCQRNDDCTLPTSLVLGGEGLEVPGILQGLHLFVNSPAEQADEVQAVQFEL